MRAKELYEAGVQPGTRRNVDLKISELRRKKDDVERYIHQLKNMGDEREHPPEVMDKLIVLRNKFQAEIDRLADLANQDLGTLRSKMVNFYNKSVARHCSQAISEYKKAGRMLYRGTNEDSDVFVGKPFEERRTKDSDTLVSEKISQAMLEFGFKATRENSIFCSGSKTHASGYGSTYMIFPFDGFDFTWSTEYSDKIFRRSALQMTFSPTDAAYVKEIIMKKPDWERPFELRYCTFNPVAGSTTPNGFLGDNWEGQYELAKKFVEEGSITDPRAIEIINNNFYGEGSAKRIIDKCGFTNESFEDAVSSGHEVYVHGQFYGIAIKHHALIRELIGMEPEL